MYAWIMIFADGTITLYEGRCFDQRFEPSKEWHFSGSLGEVTLVMRKPADSRNWKTTMVMATKTTVNRLTRMGPQRFCRFRTGAGRKRSSITTAVWDRCKRPRRNSKIKSNRAVSS